MLRFARLHCACLALVLAGGAGALAAPPGADDLDALIRDRLEVTAYSLPDYTPPADPGAAFEAVFNVGGVHYTLSLKRDEINAPGATMVLDYGNGQLEVVAPPPSGIYSGVVLGVPASSVVAQLVNGRFSAMVLVGGRPAWHVQPLDDVQRGLPGHVLYTQDACIDAGDLRCGNLPGELKSDIGTSVHPEGGQILICDVACEADFQFTQTHALNASFTAQDIARVMAWSSKFFTEAANVKFRITRYVIRINNIGNYTTSNAGLLLDAFRNRWNLFFSGTERDIAHLFTGRNLDGAAIGLGLLGVICNVEMAYGLSETTFSNRLGRRASLTAHEIGHNFNAQHCDEISYLCAPCGIMLAAMGFGPAQVLEFGCSSPLLEAYALTRPCLDPESAGLCRADINNDGRLDLADFGAFQTAFAMGITGIADFDNDGVLTLADFGAFQNAFAIGCP